MHIEHSVRSRLTTHNQRTEFYKITRGSPALRLWGDPNSRHPSPRISQCLSQPLRLESSRVASLPLARLGTHSPSYLFALNPTPNSTTRSIDLHHSYNHYGVRRVWVELHVQHIYVFGIEIVHAFTRSHHAIPA